MIAEPTTWPSRLIREPSALPLKTTWLTPVMNIGYTNPQRTVKTITEMKAVMRSRRMSAVEVGGEGLHERAEQEGREEGERADEDDHADQQHHERRVVGAHRPQARRARALAGQRTADREREEDRRVAREEHVERPEQVG